MAGTLLHAYSGFQTWFFYLSHILVKMALAASSDLCNLIMPSPLSSSPSLYESLSFIFLHILFFLILLFFPSGPSLCFLCVGAAEHHSQRAPPGECAVRRGGRQRLHHFGHTDQVPGQGKKLDLVVKDRMSKNNILGPFSKLRARRNYIDRHR